MLLLPSAPSDMVDLMVGRPLLCMMADGAVAVDGVAVWPADDARRGQAENDEAKEGGELGMHGDLRKG